jgi:hypothetical protein
MKSDGDDPFYLFTFLHAFAISSVLPHARFTFAFSGHESNEFDHEFYTNGTTVRLFSRLFTVAPRPSYL